MAQPPLELEKKLAPDRVGSQLAPAAPSPHTNNTAKLYFPSNTLKCQQCNGQNISYTFFIHSVYIMCVFIYLYIVLYMYRDAAMR